MRISGTEPNAEIVARTFVVAAAFVLAFQSAPRTDPSSVAQAVSYIGNWYVSNLSACKDKPGESAEMITYTRDRTRDPELSCKVLRTTPRGAATELDLLCNGEGQRGIRRKELVEVINGHLEVTYVANGRKSTDKYLRCP